MSWAPFNSVINSYEVVKNFKDKECIINKPSLSSEQLEEIEQSIIDSYTNGSELIINYYYNSRSVEVKGVVIKLDIVNKRIILTGNNKIYFNDILSVNNA